MMLLFLWLIQLGSRVVICCCQAEDGIRDLIVTGVQTCALPISGGILVARLMKRGVAGFVTDGGLRDSPEIARLAIPTYHQRPSAPANITFHLAVDANVPIGCGDVAVFPGDVILGD